MNMFSQRLRQERVLTGKNQIDIAEYLGVSVQSYSAYESGREPKYEHLCKLSNYFKCSTDYLLGKTGDKSSDINIIDMREMLGISGESLEFLKETKDVYARNLSTLDMLIKNMKYMSKSGKYRMVLELLTFYFNYQKNPSAYYVYNEQGKIVEYNPQIINGTAYIDSNILVITPDMQENSILQHIEQALRDLKASIVNGDDNAEKEE